MTTTQPINKDNTVLKLFETGYKKIFTNEYKEFAIFTFIIPLLIVVYLYFKYLSKYGYTGLFIGIFIYIILFFMIYTNFAYIVGILNDELIKNGSNKSKDKDTYGFTVFLSFFITLLLIHIISFVLSYFVNSGNDSQILQILNIFFSVVKYMFILLAYYIFIMFNANKFVAFS